jgi:signal recognition particle receptor subunit beta
MLVAEVQGWRKKGRFEVWGGWLMVVFNYSGREINAKIVYYGPGLSGKTTNLEFVYDKTSPHLRGKMVSMKTKADRTLFFDFLPIEGGEIAGFKIRFLLYTVPGQVYYNATRKLVLKGADAIVFVADSQAEELAANRESLKNLRDNLAEYGKSIDEIPWVIQYNKRDLPSALPVDKLEQELNPGGAPGFEGVATTGIGVLETLAMATRLVVNNLRKELGQDQDEEVDPDGQEISFGMVSERSNAQQAEGQAEDDSSTIKEATSHVPSPGEEPSAASATADISCPPSEGVEAAPLVRPAQRGYPALQGEGSEPGLSNQALATCDRKLRIPIKVSGKGKPGHVVVNLAVDVEIVVDEEDKTI